MKIISSFKDYYDCGKKFDNENSHVYIRESIEEKVNFNLKNKYVSYDIVYDGFSSFVFELKVIGFCGEIYFFLTDQKDNYFYNYKSLEKFVEECSSKLKNRNMHALSNNEKFLKYHKEYFQEEYVKKFDRLKEYFQYKDKEIPVFCIERNYRNMSNIVIYNCLLKKYNFMKVFDPYVAYHKIDSYLNNKAIPIKEIPKISDEIMIEIKGFDLKTSFRKPKSKK